MTTAKQEADRILVNFLRNQVTDINATRLAAGGQWIFPDFPRIGDLGDSSFPRMGVTILDESSDPMGIFDDNQWESLTFQIDIVTKKGLTYSLTTTDEALGTMSASANSNRMTFTNIPNTVTNIKHNTVAFGTVTKVATDALFTSPSAGTVQWSYSSGNLNFAAADIASYDTQAITSTSVNVVEGKKAAQYLARQVIKAIRNNWRTDGTLNGLFYPLKIGNTPIPYDEEFGIFRQTIEYQFRAYNTGEGL